MFLKHIKAKIYCRWKRATQFVFLTLLNAEEACSQGLHMHQEPSAPDPSGNLQHLQQLSMLVPQIALLQSTKSSTIFSCLPPFAVQQGCHIKPRVVERRAGPKIVNYLCNLRATRKQELSEKMFHCPYKTRMVTSLSAGIRRRDRAGEAPAAAARAESSSSLDRLPALNPALGVSRPLRSSLHIINTETGAD